MRKAEVARKTKETDIVLSLAFDEPKPIVQVDTGIGFFDHMLTALAVHAGLSLSVSCKGDLHVDCHHTIEDVGIVLGDALCKALGDKSGIVRYGSFYIPMDEALGFASIDISGRPYFVFHADFTADRMGEMDTQMVEEFFRAVAFHAGITLHLSVPYGTNDHHKAEALFKAFAHALKAVAALNADGSVLSTKGVL